MAKLGREVPWVERRKGGVFSVFWYEPPTEEEKRRNPRAKGETRRVGLRTRDAGEAQARLAAFLAEGYHKKVARGQLTVAGALDQYLHEHVTVTNVVAKDRARIAASHLAAFFGDLPLPEIGIPECRAYAAKRGEVVSGSTIRRELVVLRAAAWHAERWKRLSLDKMPKFELPPESDDGQHARWFTKEELDKLIRRAEGRLLDFVVLTYWWGARKGSVEGLEARQVQWDRGLVNLQKAGEQVTNKRRPIVPIFSAQREALERRLNAAEDGWLFGQGYETRWPFQKLCEACGFEEERRHPHLLRHSRATHMLMDDVPIYKVAKLLGDTVKTIENVYGHYSPEFLAEVS